MSFSLFTIFGGQASYSYAAALFGSGTNAAQSTIGGIGGVNAALSATSGADMSAVNDIISLSAQASAMIHGMSDPAAPSAGFAVGLSATSGTSSMSQAQYASALWTTAETMGGIGGSITFTFAEATGSSGTPIISGPGAGEVTTAIAKAKATLASGAALPTPGNAIESFAQIYAQQSADGFAGRFYKGINVDQYTSGMSAATKSSFVQAFDSHTLVIQPVNDATGTKSTGTLTTTFFAGSAGGGMTQSGTGSSNVSKLMQTQQHVLTNYDPFFGTFVVAWGGPLPVVNPS